MSSSIFEVKDSESDSEQVLDFGLDACEENGIVSTQVEGEVPKDHTYTKEPDVLQGDVMNDSDNSTTQPEEMGGTASSPVKPKVGRPARNAKNTEKTKPKKAPATKKAAAAKKGKVRKDDISEEVDAISESTGNGQVVDEPSEDSPADEDAKPAKRGRKRKAEENTEEESATEASDTKETKEKTPKKKAKEAVSHTKGKEMADSNDTVVDTENLPPGWIRKSVTRKSGKTAGQIDVYIYSPEGIKFRSKPDVASYLTRTKSNLKLDDFDFSKKRIPVKSTSPSSNEPSKKTTKKAAEEKTKSPVSKKAPVATPKKNMKAAPTPKKSPKATPKKGAKLLVKIGLSKPKKSRATKESPAKETKSPVKGKAAKGNKKKTNA